jgi:antitoxin component YwqK of YwqJK toxin-antitoxin module
MCRLEKNGKTFCLLIKTKLFIFHMNTLPHDVLGIIASLLPTPKDFSSFSLVNKKTHIATQNPYVLLEAKERFSKRIYKYDNKSFETKLPNGTKHGEDNEYYVCGRLKSRCFWKGGKGEGEEMLWHKNGQLWSKCFWKDGKKEGEEMWWREDGQLAIKCFWKNGELVENMSE